MVLTEHEPSVVKQRLVELLPLLGGVLKGALL